MRRRACFRQYGSNHTKRAADPPPRDLGATPTRPRHSQWRARPTSVEPHALRTRRESRMKTDSVTEEGLTELGMVEHGAAELHGHEPTEITYAEQFYPARPRHLRPKARLRGGQVRPAEQHGEPVGSNPAYVEWLRHQSMLHDANAIAGQFSGQGSMFQNPFANPDPRAAIETASVWFTAYPISVIGRPGHSFLATLGDFELWETFQRIGIQGLHTGPVKLAGGIRWWSSTPSVDGHFDRISTQIDPAFGTEAEFRTMCEVAGEHGLGAECRVDLRTDAVEVSID